MPSQAFLIAFISIVSFTLAAESVPGAPNFSKDVQINVNKLNTDFAKLLLENGLEPEKNVLFSPLNIYTALALVHLGANGTTRAELASVLGFPADELQSANVHENFGQLLRSIQNNTDTNTVELANGMFVQNNLKIKDSYLQGMKNYYESEIQQLDFAKGGPEATNAVNKWVASKTKDRIAKLLDTEISTDVKIILASALYFAGKWQYQFSPHQTKLESFNTGVKTIQLQTMNHAERVLHLKNKDLKFEAISLPYLKGDYSMLIVLPDQDQSIETLIKSLNPQHISEILSSMKSTYVDYKIPRMKFRWSHDINDQLTKLGIKQAFIQADLHNMVDLKNLKIAKVTHAAEIEVDEKGTTATAVTVIQAVSKSAIIRPNSPIPFYVNRSYLMSIYHQETGLILFTGIVQNPTPDGV